MRNSSSILPLVLPLALLPSKDIIAHSHEHDSSLSPFQVIIDGGSTGSRLHIFEFEHDEGRNETSLHRKGSTKAYVPLTAFARTSDELGVDDPIPINSTHVAQHLLPLFEHAAEVIPAQYHLTTPVKYQATAGMRLLDIEEQEAVYDALYIGLIQHPSFVFQSMKRRDIATLSGELEAFYGAIAANYIQGLIDVELNIIDDDQSKQGPIGALDMGGASMQIGFLPSATELSTSDIEHNESSPNRLDKDSFFSMSYLAYGVDQFRERLWDDWVEEHERESTCSANVIYDPCSFKGYERMWRGKHLIGIGNAADCKQKIKALMDRDNINSEESLFQVSGVVHPKLSGKFLGMALFFFTLDCLRHLSTHEGLKSSWPNPSIGELSSALNSLCSRSWQDDLYNVRDTHEYTAEEVLPERCFESVYLVTLLKDGFGFAEDSRDITFTYLLNGDEVEWSMGMAIASFSADIDANSDLCTENEDIRNHDVGKGINKSQGIERTVDDETMMSHSKCGHVQDKTSPLSIFGNKS